MIVQIKYIGHTAPTDATIMAGTTTAADIVFLATFLLEILLVISFDYLYKKCPYLHNVGTGAG